MATREPAPTIIATSWLQVGETRVRALTAGEGPPVLLVPGLFGWAEQWTRVIPLLAGSHRVAAIDLPGFGLSPRLSDPPSMAFHPRESTYARAVAGAMEVMGMGSATVVGHSLGGLVAMLLAAQRPERVDRLVLLATAGLGRGIVWPFAFAGVPRIGEFAQWAATPATVRAFLNYSVIDESVITDDVVERAYRYLQGNALATGLALAKGFSELRRSRPLGQEWRAAFAGISARALLVWGEHDPVIPPRHGFDGIHLLPHSALLVLPDCGHLTPMEKPDAVAEAILRFAAKV